MCTALLKLVKIFIFPRPANLKFYLFIYLFISCSALQIHMQNYRMVEYKQNKTVSLGKVKINGN